MAINLEVDDGRESRVLSTKPIVAAVLGLLAILWGSLLYPSSEPYFQVVHGLLAAVLVLFVPGALLTRLLRAETRHAGTFPVFAVGLSIGVLTLLTTVTSIALPYFGVTAPLSVMPLATGFSLLLVCLVVIAYVSDVTLPKLTVDLAGSSPVLILLALLPTTSILAAASMNRWEVNLGMYAFVGLLLVVVVLSSTRVLPVRLYPVAILSVSVSTLLHRNLLTGNVVGADIQGTYVVAQRVAAVGSWSPETAGTVATIPVVSVLPAVVSQLTGLPVALTFKVLYVFVFALVPVGIFYVARDVFDDDVALYGALFFLFYHGSFFFTPGKQLVSELFVVLLLLVLFSRTTGAGRLLTIALLSLALVQSHYGMTYVFGIALLGAALITAVVRRLVPTSERPLSIGYPVLLLGAATAWYAYASSELIATLSSIPLNIVAQVSRLLLTGTIEGSGVSYVAERTGPIEELQVLLYFLLTALVAVGVGWRTLSHLARMRRGGDPGRVGYTGLAIPMLVLLGASYVLVFNLWADRVYQLVLPVLAPFMAFGYGRLSAATRSLFRRSHGAARARPQWFLLAILLGAFLAFNSGLAFAMTGSAETSTFNAEANDLVFSHEEQAGADWIKRHGGITEFEASGPPADGLEEDDSNRVSLYTDPVSFQLFRAVFPTDVYDVDIVLVKSRWLPTFDRSRIGEGYVYVRERGITTAADDETLPPSYFSPAEVDAIRARSNVVYSNDDVVVMRSGENFES